MQMLADRIFEQSSDVRYVAIYRDGELLRRSRPGTANTSGDESDKYEELLVNPAVLLLAGQRGAIDCGGLHYVLIRYGNFFQFIFSQPWGHASVCIEAGADPLQVGLAAQRLVLEHRFT